MSATTQGSLDHELTRAFLSFGVMNGAEMNLCSKRAILQRSSAILESDAKQRGK